MKALEAEAVYEVTLELDERQLRATIGPGGGPEWSPPQYADVDRGDYGEGGYHYGSVEDRAVAAIRQVAEREGVELPRDFVRRIVIEPVEDE